MLNNLDANCLATDLRIGTSFITTNLGLQHSITDAYSGTDIEGARGNIPAISYLNNTLENCEVNQIDINFLRESFCSGPQCTMIAWVSTTISAQSTCTVPAAQPPYSVTFKTNYAAWPGEQQIYLNINPHNQASMYVGSILSGLWYSGLLSKLAISEPPDGSLYANGQAHLKRGNTADIESMDFFNYSGSFGYINGTTYGLGPNGADFEWAPLSFWNDTENDIRPYMPQQLDVFAKALYSEILVDLGQNDGPNMLTNRDILQHYLDETFKVGSVDDLGIYNPVKQIWAGNITAQELGSLGAKPARIFLQYICQVPKLKGAGQLIFAVIIGDLVLLQAFWKCFKMVVDLNLSRADVNAMHCEGCVKGTQTRGCELPKAEATPPTANSADRLHTGLKTQETGSTDLEMLNTLRSRSHSTSITCITPSQSSQISTCV